MPDYLPDDPIVDINAVIYQYTTIKNTSDDMLVHVQNKNANGTGYIFRETDDWSGLPSGSINKFVPVDNVPATLFGEGSVEVEGTGQVVGQAVRYNYRIDNVTTDLPPAYIPDIKTDIDVYNVLEDDAVSTENTEVVYSEEEDTEPDKKKEEERLERGLRAAKSAVGIGDTVAQQQMMAAMTQVTLDSYAARTIDGGTYKEDVSLNDSKIPDNRNGLRNGLAQQILHNKMVDSQYGGN